ncbi:MAG: hypothetical protein ACD_57C00297G0004 [uncultured bacterium]|nr:MAG: hypothetical protein ACD_57C00297G0004 [uncultured bacterium]
MGHVRDLPRGEFGVDVENGFTPKYVIPKEKIKSVNSLVKEAANIDHLWLATDPDREGEAIAWNLLEVINQKSTRPRPSRGEVGKAKSPKYDRVVFHEITRDAVIDAFGHPRKIDMDLVEAQQARRVLDRLVGYKLSPLLWKKVKSGLSAGRVQSVALRLVVDREREIEAFKSEEYWEVLIEVSKVTKVTKESKGGEKFVVKLIQINGEKAEIGNKDQAEKIVADLEKSQYKVTDVRTKDVKKYPSPPFTTSTLQQVASTKFGFTPKRTMRIAQDLYEHGLITYMRTDSVNLAPQAIEAARRYIEKTFGKKYLPNVARKYKVKSKLAQEAHEAIRPTNITVDSSQLTVDSSDHKKLYDLIWRRMVSCQTAEAVVAETQVDVEAVLVRGPVSRFLPASARSKQKSIRDQKDNVELRAVGNPFTTATPRIADILSIALAYELLHSFLLIHDDIIDESSTRRGRTTIHRRYEKKTSRHYGMSQAIVLGDIACFEALDLVNCSSFTDSQKVACFAKIISTIIETGYGEGLDVEYSNRWTNFNNIRQMTELKTAKYTFVGPLTVGAILGKANKSQIDALSKLGLLIGLAFQIQDDILGVFGKEKVVGKSVLGDLREGKNTLLIHKTKEMLSGKKREELARIWGKKNAGNRDLKRVQKLIINSGALFWAENEKAKLVKSAKVYIKSITRDNDLQSSFSELADFVITRDK